MGFGHARKQNKSLPYSRLYVRTIVPDMNYSSQQGTRETIAIHLLGAVTKALTETDPLAYLSSRHLSNALDCLARVSTLTVALALGCLDSCGGMDK